MLGSLCQQLAADSSGGTGGIKINAAQIGFKFVAVCDKAIQKIIVSQPFFYQQFGQGSRQVCFATGPVLQEALRLLDQFDRALIGDDQAGIILAGCKLYLPVQSRGFRTKVCTEDQDCLRSTNAIQRVAGAAQVEEPFQVLMARRLLKRASESMLLLPRPTRKSFWKR